MSAFARPPRHWALSAVVLPMLSGGGCGGLGGDPCGGSSNSQLVQWIEAHGTLVPATAYGGTSGGSLYVISDSAAGS